MLDRAPWITYCLCSGKGRRWCTGLGPTIGCCSPSDPRSCEMSANHNDSPVKDGAKPDPSCCFCPVLAKTDSLPSVFMFPGTGPDLGQLCLGSWFFHGGGIELISALEHD